MPDLDREITVLQSIKYRLRTWVPRPDVVTVSYGARVSHDAPIFIVHGSDTLRAESVAHTVTSATGRKTIILRDEPNLGRTLIEKFEQHAAEVSYAIIVLTADNKGSRADETDTRLRGRQNVIFEMGYFFGVIGRGNVSVLLRPGVEKPSDMDGIVYINFDDNRAWKSELLRELRHAGLTSNCETTLSLGAKGPVDRARGHTTSHTQMRSACPAGAGVVLGGRHGSGGARR